jgi:predicted Zn-dependent peptidase
MNKIELIGLDETVNYEKLDNGLDIYILEKKDFHTSSAYFITNFGSIDNVFKINKNEKFNTYPFGIAHFLEHKLFERPNGVKVMEEYAKLGAQCNAFTNYKTTAYYFTCSENFEECLNYLIDFVQDPYLTDENVENEKGIIIEELKMNKDNIGRNMYFNTMDSVFKKVPYGYQIVGEEEDIRSITKEKLMDCYNTFYNPSNMCLIVVSNKNAEDVLNIIKENQNKKEFKNIDIIKKKINEPYEVNKKHLEFYENTSKTRISYNFKIKIDDFNMSKSKLSSYISILFSTNFGSLSEFRLNLKKDKTVDNMSYSFDIYDNFLIISIEATASKDEDKIIEKIKEKINNLEYNLDDFELVKKSIISSYIYGFSSVGSIINYLYGEYYNDGKIEGNKFLEKKDLNYEEFENLVSKLSFENSNVVIMKPNKNKE